MGRPVPACFLLPTKTVRVRGERTIYVVNLQEGCYHLYKHCFLEFIEAMGDRLALPNRGGGAKNGRGKG
jgi:hypothetical protein